MHSYAVALLKIDHVGRQMALYLATGFVRIFNDSYSLVGVQFDHGSREPQEVAAMLGVRYGLVLSHIRAAAGKLTLLSGCSGSARLAAACT